MKFRFSYTRPLAFAAAAGLAGFLLRLMLYRVGFDDRGILSDTHPLHIECLVLAALMAVYLGMEARSARGRIKIKNRGLLAKFRMAAGICAGILLTLRGAELTAEREGLLAVLRLSVTFLAALGMLLSVCLPRSASWTRVLSHCLVCCYYPLEMLCRYQGWSGNPQLPDYVFQVPACIFLALGTYHRLAAVTGIKKRPALAFCSLMGLFLCLLCAAGPESRIFYWSGACWCISMFLPEAPVKKPREVTPDVPA